jgi:hypothetical protein
MAIPNPSRPHHSDVPTQSPQPSTALPARASTLIIGGGPSGLVSLKYAREYGPSWAEGEGPVLVEMEGDVGGTFRWVHSRECRAGIDGGLAGWTGLSQTGDGPWGWRRSGTGINEGRARIVISVPPCTACIMRFTEARRKGHRPKMLVTVRLARTDMPHMTDSARTPLTPQMARLRQCRAGIVQAAHLFL